MSQQRRNCYRVHYTQGQGPRLKLSDGLYPVIDLSEGGLSFCADVSLFHTGDYHDIRVIFSDGEQFKRKAEVVRLSRSSISLRFADLIPYKKIVEEQLRLKNAQP